MRTLRNVFRRKARVFLTVSGIGIGVLALVAMGGMAEKIDLLVAGAARHFSDKVMVSAEGSGSVTSSGPMSLSKLSELRGLPGVAEVSGGISTLLDGGTSFTFGMPAMIMASDMRGEELESFRITYSQGRGLTPEDQGAVTVGSDLVDRLSAEVGGYITVRGERFKVIGILDKTLTAPDSAVWMTLSDAQRLFAQDLSEMIRSQVDDSDVVNSFTVYPTPGTDPEELAAVINRSVAGVVASGPSAFQEQVGNATRMLNAILYGIAIIALIVGGLSVINTMTMAVNERTPEIGVRKAIGASDGQILRQFLTEAAVIGLVGGLAGLFLGWLATTIANALLADSGLNLFLVTPRLAIGAVAFAVVLGLASGVHPSLHAARMEPVAALRTE